MATTAAVAVGGAAMVWPFVGALAPDAETVAAGAPVELDLAPIAEGQIVKIFWRGKLIFVRHRTPAEIKAARGREPRDLARPAGRRGPRQARSCPVAGRLRQLHPSRLRAARQAGEYHGWFCPCHGSVFDTSGRIRQGPAPINLPIPPYTFVSDTKIKIGEGGTAAA